MKFKLSVIVLGLFISISAAADDSVYCENYSKLDVVLTDAGTLSVRHSKHFSLLAAEIKYARGTDFEKVINRQTKLKNERVSKIKLTFDNGTSVRNVYLLDWEKFEDGSKFLIRSFNLFPAVPKGMLEEQKPFICKAAQS